MCAPPAAEAATAGPVVKSVAAKTGATAGGTTVTVTGSGFAHVSKVLFGSSAGSQITVRSDSRLTVVSPRHGAGLVNVRVVVHPKSGQRTSAKTTADHFTFIAPPGVDAVSPRAGVATGVHTVTVSGSRFTKLTRVSFGSSAGTHMKVLSSTKLTVTTPRHAVGVVNVRVTGRYGISAVSSADQYRYTVPPGGLWSATTPAVPASDYGDGELYSVSCRSATHCVAVGFGGQQTPLIETLSGHKWTGIMPRTSPTATPYGYLYGVSCPSTTACVAVGFTFNGTYHPVLATLSGGTWTLANVAIPGGVGELLAVSCTSATACVAVGYSGSSETTPVVMVLSGTTWTATTAPTQGEEDDGLLAGVSCTSATACVAVGQESNGSSPYPLVETLSGSTWTESTAPAAATGDATLAGVSCWSATRCVAVGTGFHTSTDAPMAETLSGTKWTPSYPPLPAGYGPEGQLTGVSCTAATTCTSVGDGAVVEQLSGAKWTAATPLPKIDADLAGVTCRAATACTAVGIHDSHPLVETRTQ